ncbi:uncharacterized protein LOC134535920 [Bacillus rossius redtenbacheri]|uniref:uncharacterized protein LOC134535920 n=1 Tax=Bacillus rossius redtenbacheri TaxID=93214 RepID=UPI002FDCDC26
MDDSESSCIRRRKLCAVVALTSTLAREKSRCKIKRRARQWWTKPWLQKRDEGNGHGMLSLLRNELRLYDTESFRNFVRMNGALFDELLGRVCPIIQKQNTVMREAIKPRDRLAVTLRYLATGCTYKDLQYSTRIAASTLGVIIPETLQAIYDTMRDECIKAPDTPAEWEVVSNGYHSMWQLPHCIGALDGKHINFRPPRNMGSFFRNYKGHDSIVLLALVDAEYKFLYVNVGVNGRMNDAGVFRESDLSEALLGGTLNLPKSRPLPGRDLPMPFVIVADDAFPLTQNIMKPYPDKNLCQAKRIFNYRLCRGRRVVENAFGMMSNKFRILLSTLQLPVKKVELLTAVCCILHNFILLRKNVHYLKSCVAEDTAEIDDFLPVLQGLSQQGGNHHSRGAAAVRNEFSEYFSGVGSVPWQDSKVRLNQW